MTTNITSYDEIYTEFITNCKTDDINLPNTTEKIYDAIRSAVKHFNVRLGDNLKCDDLSESVDRELGDFEILLLAHYLRLTFLKNQLTYSTSLWQPFARDIGLKNYQSQVKSLEFLIEDEKNTIERLIMNNQEDFL